jgi:uncharacterized protein DUF3489
MKKAGTRTQRNGTVRCAIYTRKSSEEGLEQEFNSSKQGEVIAMLRRPEGATVDEVASAMGWQRHTVRGLFSGTLKKKLGLTLASAQEERGRVYRIAASEPA